MKRTRLYRNQTSVVQVICSVIALTSCLVFVPNESWGQLVPQVYPTVQHNAYSCPEVQKQIGEAVAAAETACGNEKTCIQKALECENSEAASANASLDGASVGESCDSLVSTACVEQNVGASQAAREEKRAAGTTRKEATAAKEKAAEEFQKAQTDAKEKQNEAAKQMVELRKEYRDKREAIMKEEEEALSKAQQAKLEGVRDAQKAYDEIDSAYIKMRDELRTLADVISNGDLTWKTGCRGSALQKSKEVQALMDKRMEEEDNAVNRINNQTSGLFGLRFRRLNKKRKRIADEYNETLVRCLKGELDPGLKMKVELDKARLQYASKEKLAQDQAAQLENRRKNLATQLEALQKSVDEQMQKTATRLKQQLANAEEDFNQNMQLAQQQQAAAQQTAQQGQAANLKKLEEADRELQQAAREQTLASNRLLCADRHGGRATTASTTRSNSAANINAAKKLLSGAKGLCGSLDNACGANSRYSQDEQAAIAGKVSDCNLIDRMVEGESAKDARSRPSSRPSSGSQGTVR